MKIHSVPQTVNYAVSRPRARILITLTAILSMAAFVLTRQTHATAPTLESDGVASQAAAQKSEAAGQESSAQGQVTSGNPVIDGVVMASSEKYGVDPRLVLAVMKKESRFNPRARSPKKAVGLMQILPATAHRFHKSNPADIAENVDCGVHYLRWLLEKFSGDVRLTLAGYNAGENAVVHCGYRVPNISETRNYVESIVANYGQTHHPVLDPDEAWQLFNPDKSEADGS